MEPTLLLCVLIFGIAFIAEYMDSTLGMGYGTTLTPVLLLMGFDPMQIVPAILLSEFLTGIAAGFTHHSFGNVDFKPKIISMKDIKENLKELGLKKTFSKGLTRPLKVVVVLSVCSIVGSFIAVGSAVRLPPSYLKVYIGFLVALIGIVILIKRKRKSIFSWKKIIFLGFLASFNKGMSGGGYGPVVTGGQLLAGVDGKNAIAITSLSEGLTCLLGIAFYCIAGEPLQLALAPFLIGGSLLSVPFSAMTVKKLAIDKLAFIIGGITLVLGVMILVQSIL